MGGVPARWGGGRARASRGDVRVAACAHACLRPCGPWEDARARGQGWAGTTWADAPQRLWTPVRVSGGGSWNPMAKPSRVEALLVAERGLAREEGWARGGSREAQQKGGEGDVGPPTSSFWRAPA